MDSALSRILTIVKILFCVTGLVLMLLVARGAYTFFRAGQEISGISKDKGKMAYDKQDMGDGNICYRWATSISCTFRPTAVGSCTKGPDGKMSCSTGFAIPTLPPPVK